MSGGFFHSAYGLCLYSNLPIPGLPPAPETKKFDIAISLGRLPRWASSVSRADRIRSVGPNLDEHGNPTRIVWQCGDGKYFHYRYSDQTEFVVDCAGTQVWAEWPDSLTVEDTATYLLGPIFGFILRLRGVISLHASGIVDGGRVFALTGEAGSGKSTAAAAFANQGMPVITDDVLGVLETNKGFKVLPSYPRIRLWPDAVAALYGSENSLPRLTPTWDKRYLNLPNADVFNDDPVPLAAIYVLGNRSEDASAPAIEEVSGNEQLIRLVRNSYVNYMLDKEMRKDEFEFFCRLMSCVPVRRVTPHVSIAKVSALCDAVLTDFRGLAHANSQDD